MLLFPSSIRTMLLCCWRPITGSGCTWWPMRWRRGWTTRWRFRTCTAAWSRSTWWTGSSRASSRASPHCRYREYGHSIDTSLYLYKGSICLKLKAFFCPQGRNWVWVSLLKGIVHPKMKILSFTHPQVVPNLFEFLCSAEHKGRYSEESL